MSLIHQFNDSSSFSFPLPKINSSQNEDLKLKKWKIYLLDKRSKLLHVDLPTTESTNWDMCITITHNRMGIRFTEKSFCWNSIQSPSEGHLLSTINTIISWLLQTGQLCKLSVMLEITHVYFNNPIGRIKWVQRLNDFTRVGFLHLQCSWIIKIRFK